MLRKSSCKGVQFLFPYWEPSMLRVSGHLFHWCLLASTPGRGPASLWGNLYQLYQLPLLLRVVSWVLVSVLPWFAVWPWASHLLLYGPLKSLAAVRMSGRTQFGWLVRIPTRSLLLFNYKSLCQTPAVLPAALEPQADSNPHAVAAFPAFSSHDSVHGYVTRWHCPDLSTEISSNHFEQTSSILHWC